jgi:hypothetical protein
MSQSSGEGDRLRGLSSALFLFEKLHGGRAHCGGAFFTYLSNQRSIS